MLLKHGDTEAWSKMEIQTTNCSNSFSWELLWVYESYPVISHHSSQKVINFALVFMGWRLVHCFCIAVSKAMWHLKYLFSNYDFLKHYIPSKMYMFWNNHTDFLKTQLCFSSGNTISLPSKYIKKCPISNTTYYLIPGRSYPNWKAHTLTNMNVQA